MVCIPLGDSVLAFDHLCYNKQATKPREYSQLSARYHRLNGTIDDLVLLFLKLQHPRNTSGARPCILFTSLATLQCERRIVSRDVQHGIEERDLLVPKDW